MNRGCESFFSDQLFLHLDLSELPVSHHVCNCTDHSFVVVAVLHFCHQFGSLNHTSDAHSLPDGLLYLLDLTPEFFPDCVAEFFPLNALEGGDFKKFMSLVDFITSNFVFEFHSSQRLAESDDSFELPDSDGDRTFGIGQNFVLESFLPISNVDILKSFTSNRR